MNSLFSKVLSLTIFLIFLSSNSYSQECTLNGPELINIEETEHSISFEWEPVEEAVVYQINLYSHDGDELIQQLQTIEPYITFDGLPSNTFFTVSSQSGCTEDAFGPENYQGEKARTRSGLVIVVEDINIVSPTEECGSNGVDTFATTVGSVPIAPLGLGEALYLNIFITTPGSVLEDEFFEIIVFKNTMTSFPTNLLVGVLQNHLQRITIDQNHGIWMNEAGRPNNWHYVAQVNDVLAPGNIVEMRWVEDVIVEHENCISFTYDITPPPGHHNPALTSQTSTNKPAATLTTKETTTPLAYPNPVADRLTLELPAEGGMVQVMDINGKVWHQENTQNLRLEVDMSNWPAGTYILRYDDGKAPHIQRIVKL